MIQGHRSGQSDGDAVGRGQAQGFDFGAQRLDGGGRRFQDAFAQLRSDDQETAVRGQQVGVAGDQTLPGQGERLSLRLGLSHLRHLLQQAGQRFGGLALGQELRLPERLRQDLGQPADVRPGGKLAEQRLRRHQAIRKVVEFVEIEVEKTGFGEDPLAARLVDVTKKLRAIRQAQRQRAGGLGGVLRRRRLDNRHNRVRKLWEERVEATVVLPKGNVRGDHIGRPGVDTQAIGHVP